MKDQQQKQVYVILSVDTEHDLQSYKTQSNGWSDEIPLLLQVFDVSGAKGKVCWLLEYNVKEGIPAANPDSKFFVKEFPEIIKEIKDRGDDFGIHPSMIDWIGKEEGLDAYNDIKLWDLTKRLYSAEFVMSLITSAVNSVAESTGSHPIGCRTGCMYYATHLASALENNGVYVDTSVSKVLAPWIIAPAAYYAAEDDIRRKSTQKTGVLEIPTTGYICFDRFQKLLMLKPRIRYLLHHRQPVFLSFFIHNWQAITSDGKADSKFLERLSSFLGLLKNNGACFLSWTEAYQMYTNLYGKELGKQGVR